jgi:ketosteroid isomerase-like protein
MKYSKSLAFILLLTALVSSTLAGDKEDVETVITKAWTGFNSKDYQTYFTYWADDLEVFTGVVTPLLHMGKPHLMEFVNGFGQLPSVTYRQQQNTVRVYNGNTAVVNGYFLFTVVGKDGTTTNQSGRNSTNPGKAEWQVADSQLPFLGDVLA